MEINKIYNMDCMELMGEMNKKSVDVVLTSPFYNTNKKARRKNTINNTQHVKSYAYVRYDVHIDDISNDEYCDFTVNLFNKFDEILKENGSILYNLSYGTENTEGMFRAVNDILTKTNFTLADTIVWKKRNAIPNNVSRNRMTRITEFVFVFCRKTEAKTFHMNKKIVSLKKNGQKNYENILNFIEAKNNDKPCNINRSTYSTDLCTKLLNLYAPTGGVVFDPFMGTGTTANACVINGFNFIGSEISKDQCNWANDRLKETVSEMLKNNGLLWESDWDGGEVGYNHVSVVGLYTLAINTSISFYIDMGKREVLEVFFTDDDI